MRIRIISIAHKPPEWIQTGFNEYAKRLSSNPIELINVPASKRSSHSDVPRLMKTESVKMLSLIPASHYVVALEVTGKMWSTEELATHLQKWQRAGKNVDLLIGGPEGLHEDSLARADEKWSLSRLTFPHLLVRLILIEQLYRAQMILNQHPYHK